MVFEFIALLYSILWVTVASSISFHTYFEIVLLFVLVVTHATHGRDLVIDWRMRTGKECIHSLLRKQCFLLVTIFHCNTTHCLSQMELSNEAMVSIIRLVHIGPTPMERIETNLSERKHVRINGTWRVTHHHDQGI